MTAATTHNHTPTEPTIHPNAGKKNGQQTNAINIRCLRFSSVFGGIDVAEPCLVGSEHLGPLAKSGAGTDRESSCHSATENSSTSSTISSARSCTSSSARCVGCCGWSDC